MPAVLRITDGTDYVDLINGPWYLADWVPAIAQAKDGGIFKDSPLADGKRLAVFQWDSVIETFDLKASDTSQDVMIEATQKLRRLIDKAQQYWTTEWQQTPVYIEARASRETNTRYALISHGSLQNDENYYSQPFLQPHCEAAMDEMVLMVERGHWLSSVPGTGSCLEVDGEYDFEAVAGGYTSAWALESTIANYYGQRRQESIYTATNGDVFLVLPHTTVAPAFNGTIRRSDDDGATWNIEETQADHSFHSIDNVSSTIMVATSKSGTDVCAWRSIDSGQTWSLVQTWNTVSYSPSPIIALANGDVLMNVRGQWDGLESLDGGSHMWRSTDQGQTYSYFSKVCSDAMLAAANACVQMKQISNGRIFEILGGDENDGNKTMYYSDNDGASWTKISAGWGPCNTMIQTVSGRLIALHLNSRNLIASDNNGSTWYYLTNLPLPLYYWLGLSQVNNLDYPIFIQEETTNDVYISYDDGVTWVVDDDISADIYIHGTTVLDDDLTVLALTSDISGRNIHCYSWTPTLTGGGGVEATVGAERSCENITYLANKYLPYNLTHIKQWDAGGFTDIFPISAYPQDLFSAVTENNLLYFGVVGNGVNLQPTFTSLVFDILTTMIPVSGGSIEWTYSAPAAAWSALTIADHTTTTSGQSWSQEGVECIAFEPPSDWTQVAVDGVTGFWIRAKILDEDLTTIPTQQNREIYTANLPYINIDEDDIGGDISAATQILLVNESDQNGPRTTGSPRGFINKIVLGTRSLGRGSEFNAFLNASDELTPLSVSCAVGDDTTFEDSLEAPAGRAVKFNPTGLSGLLARATWTIESTRSVEYHGTFHAYLRCYQDGGDPGDISVKVKFISGSGGVILETDTQELSTLNDFYLIDLGRVDIPSSSMIKDDEAGDQLAIEVLASSVDGTPNLWLYDLQLIPTDEWTCSSEDTVGDDDSSVEWGRSLEIDSVSHPKAMVRSLLRSSQARNSLVSAVYLTDSVGPFSILPNRDQRLWALASSRFVVEATHDGAGNLAYLSDASGDFVNQGVKTGMTVVNETDGSSAVITQVSATEIHGTLTGGTDNDWDASDVGHIITDNLVSYPWVCHSVQLWKNQRYLAARGGR